MRTLFSALSIAMIFTTSAAYAEEPLPLSGKEGKWSFSMSEPGAELKSISKEKQKKLRNLLQEISSIITSTPAMSPPKGFEARFWGSATAKDRFDSCTGKKCPPSRPTATLAMMMGRYEDSNGKVKAAFNTPSTMDISINNLGHVFAHLPVLYKDAEGYLLPEPQGDGERYGMQTFSNNGHAVAVVKRNDKPLWFPVTRERYLKAAIAAAAKSVGEPPKPLKKGKKKPVAEVSIISGKPILVEERRTWIDPVEEKEWIEKSRSLSFEMKESTEVLKERIQKLQEELNAMPQELRKMRARVDTAAAAAGDPPPLLPHDSNSGVPVVTPDFGYYSSKLPDEAAQLIVVQWKFDGNTTYDPKNSGITETLNNLRLLEILKTMDWQKLGSKISRTVP